MNWRQSKVAPCGTHHVLGGEPLYVERFDWVLPFHAPGLAPVGRGGLAWHTDESGAPAYEQRWLRSFGFYEGLSAVVSEDGWLHVLPNGNPAYPNRWAWVGNYQNGRCPARDAEGRYRHLDRHGRPVGDRTWRYAGDYREGSAVVQDDEGLSLHVDLDGHPLNEVRWLDLDVFHKGWARARDAEGWTHYPSLQEISMRRDEAAITRWNDAIVEAQRAAVKNGVLLENIHPLTAGAVEDIDPEATCPFLDREAWVAWDGRFHPCCAPHAERRSLGDFGTVYERPLSEIWLSPEYRHLVAHWREQPLCRRCNMKRREPCGAVLA